MGANDWPTEAILPKLPKKIARSRIGKEAMAVGQKRNNGSLGYRRISKEKNMGGGDGV